MSLNCKIIKKSGTVPASPFLHQPLFSKETCLPQQVTEFLEGPTPHILNLISQGSN